MAYWVIINGCCSDFHAKTVWFDAKIWHFLTERARWEFNTLWDMGVHCALWLLAQMRPQWKGFPGETLVRQSWKCCCIVHRC